MKLNSIGLSANKSEQLAKQLNILLANFQTYYQNLRGIHWNIKGKRFFDLHVKFEELYTDANTKVDDIAERVLTLGGTPYHTFEDYTEHSKVPVGKNVSKDEDAIGLIVD
jgi:starvation-inducible DNA-binding protein